MKLLISENASASGAKVVLDDIVLTKELPTTGGSRMLEGYKSPFDAEAVARLQAAGFSIAGKANIGEFAIDLLGETSYFGACENAAGQLTTAAAELLAAGDALAVAGMDVNGVPRRSAALSNQVCIKPTYGTVSRFGTIAVACSGECVCVTAASAAACQQVLDSLAGHDDKDGTSLPEEQCQRVKGSADRASVKCVALAKSLVESADEQTQQRVAGFADFLQAQGIVVEEIDDSLLARSNAAWNILMSAELCNNVSRFDGVKYGYRAQDYDGIGELYTNSRTEAFGDLLKASILFGSDVLSEENYNARYDKALRIRRVVAERFAQIFADYDAVLMPACSKASYTLEDVQAKPDLSFDENKYTAPATLTGLPAVVVGGVQLVGRAFSDASLLEVAAAFGKED